MLSVSNVAYSIPKAVAIKKMGRIKQGLIVPHVILINFELQQWLKKFLIVLNLSRCL